MTVRIPQVLSSSRKQREKIDRNAADWGGGGKEDELTDKQQQICPNFAADYDKSILLPPSDLVSAPSMRKLSTRLNQKVYTTQN